MFIFMFIFFAFYLLLHGVFCFDVSPPPDQGRCSRPPLSVTNPDNCAHPDQTHVSAVSQDKRKRSPTRCGRRFSAKILILGGTPCPTPGKRWLWRLLVIIFMSWNALYFCFTLIFLASLINRTLAFPLLAPAGSACGLLSSPWEGDLVD